MSMIIEFFNSIGWYLLKTLYSFIGLMVELINAASLINVIEEMQSNASFSRFVSFSFYISLPVLLLFIIYTILTWISSSSKLSQVDIFEFILSTSKTVIMIVAVPFVFSISNWFSSSLIQVSNNIFQGTDFATELLSNFVEYSDEYVTKSLGLDTIQDVDSIHELLKEDIKNNLNINKEFDVGFKSYYVYRLKNPIFDILAGIVFVYCMLMSGVSFMSKKFEVGLFYLISPTLLSTTVANEERRKLWVTTVITLSLSIFASVLTINFGIVLYSVLVTAIKFDRMIQWVYEFLCLIAMGGFILTGSNVINKFIGESASASEGRAGLQQMMGVGGGLVGGIQSMATGVGLMGMFGKMAKNRVADSKMGMGMQGMMGAAFNSMGSAFSNSNSKAVKKLNDVLTNAGSNMMTSSIDKMQNRRQSHEIKQLNKSVKKSDIKHHGRQDQISKQAAKADVLSQFSSGNYSAYHDQKNENHLIAKDIIENENAKMFDRIDKTRAKRK